MLFSKLQLRTDKNSAVFIVLFLIVLAYLSARLLPAIIPDNLKNADFIINGFFILFSWDMIDGVVGGAISTATQEGVQKYLSENQTDLEIREKQDLEYYAMIPDDTRRGSTAFRVRDEQDIEELRRDVLVRDSIIRGLAMQDSLLNDMVLSACIKVLRKNNSSNEEVKHDEKLTIFRNDVYIYLKTWLMSSIKYDREMRIEDIQPGYPNKDLPNRKAYAKAIRCIRDELIEKPVISSCLTEEYRKDAYKIIKKYLTRLSDCLERIR